MKLSQNWVSKGHHKAIVTFVYALPLTRVFTVAIDPSGLLLIFWSGVKLATQVLHINVHPFSLCECMHETILLTKVKCDIQIYQCPTTFIQMNVHVLVGRCLATKVFYSQIAGYQRGVGDHSVGQWWEGVKGQQNSCKTLVGVQSTKYFMHPN